MNDRTSPPSRRIQRPSRVRPSALTTLACLSGLLGGVASTASAQGGAINVRGTVTVPAGHSVARAVVVACGIKNGDCDQNNLRAVQLQGSGSKATFTVDGLKPGSYYLIGWADLNGSSEIDFGDLVGMYGSDGTSDPTAIQRTTSDVQITLRRLDAPGGNTVSGTVRLPQGQASSKAMVFTCVLDARGECDSDQLRASAVTTEGRYVLEDLPKEPFYVMAWLDVNGDGQPDAKDLYGAHRDSVGMLSRVQGPRDAVNITIAKSASEAPASAVPARLVGTWTSGTSTGVDYFDSATGRWAPPSGTGSLLEIHADGTFVRGVTVQISNYGCTTSIIGHYSGQLRLSGADLRLEPTTSKQKYTSGCNTSLNDDREVPNVALPFTWHLDGDGRLVLTWPEGGKTYYTRR